MKQGGFNIVALIVAAMYTVALISVIFIHEFGHLLAGLYVKEPFRIFEIGFWKPKLCFTIKGVSVRITPWILGGSMRYRESLAESMDIFKRLSVKNQIIISLAGVLANFISALAALFIMLQILGLNLAFGIKFIQEQITQLGYSVHALFTSHMSGMPVPYSEIIFTQITNLSSPVMMIFTVFLFLFIYFSLILGVANLIPFPPLDGWNVVQATGEHLIGRKCTFRTNLIMMYSGLTAIGIFSLYSIYLLFLL